MIQLLVIKIHYIALIMISFNLFGHYSQNNEY
jgi:hypothetical protein